MRESFNIYKKFKLVSTKKKYKKYLTAKICSMKKELYIKRGRKRNFIYYNVS